MIVLLEVLRFVAAVGVVIYHYQHFVTYTGAPYDPSAMPWSNAFEWFYRHGGTGVQVFWLLSGTVFAHVYQSSVVNRATTIVDFSRRRIARLYPLHLATLLLVAGLMFVARESAGLQHVVYHYNDLKHFLLNLLFAQYWGLESGTSFNGPSWSVSIEMIAYAIFLLIAVSLRVLGRFVRGPLSFAITWLVVVLAIVVYVPEQPDYLHMCILLFFTGALVYSVWRAANDVLVAVLVVACIADRVIGGSFSAFLVRMDLPFGALTIGVVLSLLSLSRSANQIKPVRRFSLRLGSMTYSMYLLHFPIQILMILWSENVRTVNFLDARVFTTFFVLLGLSSVLCHDWFEAPAKRLVLQVTESSRHMNSR